MQRGHAMSSRHIKECSALLTIRDMYIKTTMTYYLIPAMMTTVKKKRLMLVRTCRKGNIVDKNVN
jgi:hypothetical protein